MKRAYFNWSSGKDSAMALYYAIRSGEYDVQSLFTIVKKSGLKIAMHEIGVDLLKKQAEAMGIPLKILEYDTTGPEEEYRAALGRQMAQFKSQNIGTALFGDLYLEELRKQRESRCSRAGINAAFPLWGIDPKELLLEFVNLGFKSIVTCVDGSALDESFAGRIIDRDFIEDLPSGVDVCGENGEYHSFVFDGPLFKQPVEFEVLNKYYVDYDNSAGSGADRYWYIELT